MSAIDPALVPGFSSEIPTFGSPGGGGLGTGGSALQFGGADAISLAPNYAGVAIPNQGGGPYGGGLYGGPSSGSTGLGNFGSMLNGIMCALQNALSSLGSLFGGGPGTSQPAPVGGSMPQTMFSNATASSVGDPHDAFSGTTASGTSVDSHWDSMRGHANLLDSNSFAGGYRVATTGTAPQANGVAYNGCATVTTDGGATSVSLNANGSYAVCENGQNVTLTTGQAVSLDGGETVTRNADGSLSIADSNGTGGSITTTLKTDGSGGVDVNASASNVDLGGYLVNRTDERLNPPPVQPWMTAGSAMPMNSFGIFTSQLGGANGSANDVAQLLQGEV
jgi:hypothetical protein